MFKYTTASLILCSLARGLYQKVNEKVQFANANAKCQEVYGTDLASIHSDQEWQTALQTCGTAFPCWLGGIHGSVTKDVGTTTFQISTDFVNSDWQWMDGSLWDYSNWGWFNGVEQGRGLTGEYFTCIWEVWHHQNPAGVGDCGTNENFYPVCNAPTQLDCPSDTYQIGGVNADIGGCGMEACDDRYDKSSIEQCRDHCTATLGCLSFTWAPVGGDQYHPSQSVCTIYSTDAATQRWAPNCIMCGIAESATLSAVRDYAPVLKFDRAAEGYPMNAQIYVDNNCGGSNRCQNTILDTSSNPTYFRVLSSDVNSGHFELLFWWFYGHQNECLPGQGAHDGDWERVIVHVSNWNVWSVTYYQHGGYYTTSSMEKIGAHPVVYVGKVAHGSYYDERYGMFAGGCGYFYDFRNPGLSLSTWENLISLETSSDSWITQGLKVPTTCCSNPLTVMDLVYHCDDCGCYYESCHSGLDLMGDQCIGLFC